MWHPRLWAGPSLRIVHRPRCIDHAPAVPRSMHRLHHAGAGRERRTFPAAAGSQGRTEKNNLRHAEPDGTTAFMRGVRRPDFD